MIGSTLFDFMNPFHFLLLMVTTSPPPPLPLYITIGPPCSGKTTWLSHNKIQDIAIDDQPHVYQPLPWTYFALDQFVDKDSLLEQMVADKTIRDRLYDQRQLELRTVCASLSGKMNSKQLFIELQKQFADQNRHCNEKQLADVIAFAVSNVLRSSSGAFPSTVDLFCFEVLFAPTTDNDDNNSTPSNGLTAIERAYRKLEAVPVTQPVAWGNTNLRIDSDYRRALEMAYAQKRPVHFVVFDTVTQTCVVNPTFIACHQDDIAFCLDELMRRNIKRLLEKGRYIPVAVLNDMLNRHVEIVRRGDLLQSFLRPSRFVRDPRTGLLELKQ